MGDWFVDVLRLWAAIRGTYVRTENGVDLYVYKDPAAWDKTHKDRISFALGELIMFRDKEQLTPENLRHEMKHCEQIRKRGGFLRFYPGYCYESAKALVLTGDTDNNRFEREAIAAERE